MASKSTEWRPGPTVCRCCLSEGCYKDISTEYFWMGKREVYAEMLLDSLNLNIAYSQSGGPNSNSRLICEPCISRLRDATEFKRQVQECEKTFMQYLDPGTSVIPEMEVPLDNLESQVKLEQVKLEKQLSDEEFDDRPDFGDDDDDDLDDQPLTTFATKIPKKESVDLLDLLDNAKAGEKRKSSSKTKSTPAKKAKAKKEVKATSSKAVKPEKKKKGDEEMVNQPKIIISTTPITITKVTSLSQTERVNVIANRNSAIALIANTNNSCPFKHSNQYYMCAYCQERYADFPSLHQHVGEAHSFVNAAMIKKAFARTEKDQKIKINFMDLICKICEENFYNFKDLKIHLKQIHRKPVDVDNDGVLPYKIINNDYECLLCGIVFQNYPALNKHINSHFPYFVCKHCGMGCATSQRLRQHITNHGERLHSCEICHKGFPTISRKKEHITRVHLKAKQNRCRLCPETFAKYYEKVNHMKNVHDITSVGAIPIKPVDVAKQNENSPGIVKVVEKKKTSRESAIVIILNTNVCPFRFNGNFMCMYCQNQFVSMSDLLQHTNTVHQNITEVDIKKAVSRIAKQIPIKINISDLTCKICNHELSDFNDLKHHLVGKHKKEIDLEKDGLMAFKIAGDNYACVRCGFQCDNYKLLNKHVNDKHFNTFICDQCGLGFATKSGLQCHSMSHVSGSYPCEICGRVYRTAWSKRHHVKIDHLNIKLNKCTHCSETFKGYYQKLKHIAEVHGVRRYNYKCSFCLKSFLSNSNLRNHERTVHAQGHKYVCDNCNYHTYDKHLLKLHMICHSDEKNYKCQVCEKSYARKKTLTEHMKIHNNIRRFVCQYCDRAFVQKCSLKGHLKTHHRDVQSAEC